MEPRLIHPLSTFYRLPGILNVPLAVVWFNLKLRPIREPYLIGFAMSIRLLPGVMVSIQ
jgi:hypothetical protein